jgi:hypothetical protein
MMGLLVLWGATQEPHHGIVNLRINDLADRHGYRRTNGVSEPDASSRGCAQQLALGDNHPARLAAVMS